MTFRMAFIGVLVVVLLVPLDMVQGLIQERESHMREVEQEVSGSWGGPQQLTGPVISVPIDLMVRSVGADKKEAWVRNGTIWRHFLPDVLKVNGAMTDEMRYRGIYKVAGYWAGLKVHGHFAAIDTLAQVPERVFRWKDAVMQMGMTDLRSVADIARAEVNDTGISFEPGLPNNDVSSIGIKTGLPLQVLTDTAGLSFNVELRMKGSRNLAFIPVGRTTTVELASTWSTPSFSGAFLPVERTIGEGFTAKWNVLHLNRPYPQIFEGGRSDIPPSAFGVDLLVPVDDYQKNMRAVKYGAMLVVLVFTVFFFVEVMRKSPIHPIQYLLVGLALCIFYALLIALSEHLGFGWAYIAAAAAVLSLVVLYARSVFKMPRAVHLLALVMMLVYGFMFTTIHQEDFALLMGSVGLFLVLAVVMWLSRRIDWYRSGGDGGF